MDDKTPDQIIQAIQSDKFSTAELVQISDVIVNALESRQQKKKDLPEETRKEDFVHHFLLIANTSNVRLSEEHKREIAEYLFDTKILKKTPDEILNLE